MTQDELERIEWINSANLVDLLRRWRMSPIGDPIYHGEVGNHYSKVLKEARDADPDAWARASKIIGWK